MLNNIAPTSIFNEKIFYYESVIKNPEELIALIEDTDKDLSDDSLISTWHMWQASGDSDYVFGQRKTTNPLAKESATDMLKNIYNVLVGALDIAGNSYANSLGISVGNRAPISISKYFTGTFMGPHTDSSPSPTIEHFSAVLYLNDNYVGGELNFINQGIKIKPKAGSIVIFPSVPPYYHESMPIIEGTKYMSPAFWHLIP